MRPVHIPIDGIPGALFVWRAPRLSGHRLTAGDARALSEVGLHEVVCLLEDVAPGRLGPSLVNRRRAIEDACLGFRSFPIGDFGVPPLDELRDLVDELLAGLRRGERILVHCQAGLGRAGLVASSVLVRTGMDPGLAIARVREHRPGAVESASQVARVHELAALSAP